MKNYTIFVDGISKAFSATGVRVGWSMGPAEVINKMKSAHTSETIVIVAQKLRQSYDSINSSSLINTK
jgi:aspartate aminotransferase